MLVPKNANFRIVNGIQMHVITTEYLVYSHSPNPCPLDYVCVCVCCAHARTCVREGRLCVLSCLCKTQGYIFHFSTPLHARHVGCERSDFKQETTYGVIIHNIHIFLQLESYVSTNILNI